MSKDDTQHALVPRLRFPEFRDAPRWDVEPLGDVAQFVKNRVPVDQVQIEDYVSTENLLPDYGGVECATKLPPSGSATQYKPNDILIANIRPYLKKVWRSNKSGGASNDVIVVRPKPVLRTDYLPLIVANDAFINYVMKTAKGVKMPRGDIASMKAYDVYYPEPPEQQKIAVCLGSLDDLIAAEGRKLAGLREHKQGLLQQLFPREGETRPRLRFPEFRDKGQWGVEPLGRVARFVKKRIPVDQLHVDDYVSTENLLPEYGGVKRAAKLPPTGSATQYESDDILIANIRPYLKKVWRSSKSGGASNDVVVIRAMPKIHKDFLPHIIANDAFINYVMKTAKGVKMPRGDIESMKAYDVCFPDPAEQQRIADCLSALDALIAAQGEKLDALGTHKRGLMQQLFPSPDTSYPNTPCASVPP